MPDEKIGVLVRVPVQSKLAFEDKFPWHGSLSQFFLQSLEEFLKLAEDQKSPAQLTQEAVGNVYRRDY